MNDKQLNAAMILGLLLLLMAMLFIGAAGCTPIQQTDDTLSRLRGDIDRYRQVIATLPEDSPERQAAERALPQIEKQLAVTESLIEAAKTGDDAGILQAARDSGIPWASTGAALLLLVLREWRLRQARQELSTTETALRQVVQSVDKALPVKSETVKSAFDAVQDQSTKRIVARLRAG